MFYTAERIVDVLVYVPQIGYARVSKADGGQIHDLQRDSLVGAGVDPEHIYEDSASGRLDKRPGLDACLKALRCDDTLVIWKLDQLGRDLRKHGRRPDETRHRPQSPGGRRCVDQHHHCLRPNGQLIFAIFAGLAEFERELIVERTRAGLTARAAGTADGYSR